MKTTAASKKHPRAVRSHAERQAASSAVKSPRWVPCGPATSSLTRESIIAADEAFLSQMKAGRRPTKTAAALVREARR